MTIEHIVNMETKQMFLLTRYQPKYIRLGNHGRFYYRKGFPQIRCLLKSDIRMDIPRVTYGAVSERTFDTYFLASAGRVVS